MSAARADFGGELAVAFQGLPAGGSVETVPMAANQSQIPVLVSAAADAPLAGALVKNEQDAHLLERLAFMVRRKGGG